MATNRSGLKRVGVYGGLATMQEIMNARLASYAWQSLAWSDTPPVWDHRADIQQTRNDISVGGCDCDLDVAISHDFGQFPYHIAREGIASVRHDLNIATGKWDHAPLPGKGIEWGDTEEWASLETQLCTGGKRAGEWRDQWLEFNAPPLGGSK